VDDDHSSRPVITRGLKRPTRRLGRAVLQPAVAPFGAPASRCGLAARTRHPIWSCSVRGFACHRRYRRRGALLPHLFTLTRHAPGALERSGQRSLAPPLPLLSGPPDARRAVSFLCHCPSGIASCPGVTRRTALRSSDFPPRLRLRLRRGKPHQSRVESAAVVWLIATF